MGGVFDKPFEDVVGPTLGVSGDEDMVYGVWCLVFGVWCMVYGGEPCDDVGGGMEGEALLVPEFLLRDFVADGDLVSVPTSSGVGEVESGIDVLVEVRFVVDSVVVVVV